jgi:hypothetical protein
MICYNLLIGESILPHTEGFESIFHYSEMLYSLEEFLISLG